MPTVFKYEVVFDATNRNTKERSTLVRTEWAYGVTDAVMQAIHNVVAESSGSDLRVVSVGPPADMIALAAKEESAMVEALMTRLKDALSKDPRPSRAK